MPLIWEPVNSTNEMYSQIHYFIQFITENNGNLLTECEIISAIHSIPINIYIDCFVPTILRRSEYHSFNINHKEMTLCCRLKE